MNKSELVAGLASGADVSQAAATRILDRLIELVSKELATGGEVAISGLGTFKVVDKGERAGRNPRTGESITIAASRAAKFIPASALRERLNPKTNP